MSQFEKDATKTCHTRESGYPGFLLPVYFWIPASAGMTNKSEFLKRKSNSVGPMRLKPITLKVRVV
jgi:hypothetical protein